MKAPAWSVTDSADLYGIREWGHSYFDISKQGEVVVNLKDGKKTKAVSLASIVEGLRDRGTQLPLLIRFGDLLRGRISRFSLDALVNMAVACGQRVRMALEAA